MLDSDSGDEIDGFTPAHGEANTIHPIVQYLQDPTVPKKTITNHGGYLGYWKSQLQYPPEIARMALHYLSAPGKSRIKIFI